MEGGVGTGGTLQNGGLSRIQGRPVAAAQVTGDQHAGSSTACPTAKRVPTVQDSSVPWGRVIGGARHPSQSVCCDKLAHPWQPSSARSPAASLQKLRPHHQHYPGDTVFCQWRDSALWCAVSANYHPTSSISCTHPAGWDCQSSPRKDYAEGPRTHAAVTVISGGRKGRGLEGNQSLASALPSNRRSRTFHHNISFFLVGAGVGAVPSQQLQSILSALCDSLRLIQGQLFLPCYLNCGKVHVT